MAEKVTIDPSAKLFICKAGTTELDVRVDLYSDAKEDWRTDSSLNKYKFPFRVVGGDETDPVEGNTIPTYAFLQYGWRVRPQEADHTLKVKGGILVVDGGGDPFVDTLGDYTVRVRYSQPVMAEVLTVQGGSGLTTEEHNQLMATALEATVDTVKTDTEAIIADVADVKTDTGDILSALSTIQSTMAALSASVLSLRNGNEQRTLYLADTQDDARKVAVGAIDREVIEVKADDAADWSAPVSTKTRYFWYRNLTDTEAFAVGRQS